MVWRVVSQQRLEVAFTDIAPQGDALARHDGEVVFAHGGIPGERAVVVAGRGRRRFLSGEVQQLLSASPYRVEPRCPLFGPCSGCNWQHIDYGYQLVLKRGMVERQLRERGSFEDAPLLSTVPSPEPWHYRNHARFTADAEGRLGYVHRRSRQFIQVDTCYLMHPWINSMLQRLQGHCPGANQVAVRYGVNTGDWLVQPKLEQADIESGQTHYEEELMGRRFRIASPSFFQVNTAQAATLVEIVRDRLPPSGAGLIVDVFAGVGTFAALLSPAAERVIAIEESAAAVKDARLNTDGLDNIDFRQGKAEALLPLLEATPDAAILDPPRAGCHRRTLEALLRLSPGRIVYVSCDPFTLARDLRALCDGGYRLSSVQPVDMFPQTYHVECVATLVRADVSPDLILASASPRRRQHLLALGLDFEAVSPPEDEPLDAAEAPAQAAGRLALAKAQAVSRSHPGRVVIAADTIVVHDGAVLGKPRDESGARSMLQRLRGQEHGVITALAVISGGRAAVSHVETAVTMRRYSDGEIEEYIAGGDAMDKAGAYGVQHPLFRPAQRVEGCYLNVVGLPLCELAGMLREAGVSITPRPLWSLPPHCRECEGRGGLGG